MHCQAGLARVEGEAKGGVMAGVGEPPSLSAQALLGTRCDRKDGRATRVSCVRGHQAVWLSMCVCVYVCEYLCVCVRHVSVLFQLICSSINLFIAIIVKVHSSRTLIAPAAPSSPSSTPAKPGQLMATMEKI